MRYLDNSIKYKSNDFLYPDGKHLVSRFLRCSFTRLKDLPDICNAFRLFEPLFQKSFF